MAPFLTSTGRTWRSSRESIAPLVELKRVQGADCWRFPWVSSPGSDFKYDFGAAFTDEQQRSGAEYYFRRSEEPLPQKEGLSAFALNDGVVLHTHSTYERGLEQLMDTYRMLDLVPVGRNETASGGAATTSTKESAASPRLAATDSTDGDL
jgi:predicted dithiol-disulfide oxidoreductase (DUF899 family)